MPHRLNNNTNNINLHLYNQNLNILNDHYNLFCNNISSNIRKELNMKDDTIQELSINSDWNIPITYGLNNSERIIPQHYFDTNLPFKDIDMFYELTKDIRNLKPLDSIQLNYISTLPKDKILELIEIYNTCLQSVSQIFEKL
jgi:hypothetical protein